MNAALIYGLRGPCARSRIVYVGSTSGDLRSRLSGHLSGSKGSTTKCGLWVRRLLGAGLVPQMCLLERCDSASRAEREGLWIERYGALNVNLSYDTRSVVVTSRVQAGAEKKLRAVAKRLKTTRSIVIEQAVSEFLNRF